MDYKKHYDALIAKRRAERLAKVKYDFGKVETHHVLPKSLGGSDDDGNLVNLTSREHYLAHWLLYKMLPDCPQMAIAFKLMADIRGGERHISSKLYEKLKAIAQLASSERLSEYYKRLSPEEWLKMTKSHADVMRSYWNNMDPEFKEYWSANHSEDLLSMSPEKKASRNEKYKATMDSKPDEEKERIRTLKSASSRKRWNSMSEKDKKDFGAQFAGNNNVMRKMSEEEKLAFSLKVREGQSDWRKRIGDEKYHEFNQEHGKLLQAAYIEWCKTLSKEDRAKIVEKAKATYDSAPTHVKEQRRQRQSINSKRCWANRTPKERKLLSEKISAARKNEIYA